MISLHRLIAKNFRSLKDVDVPLGSLNVLVGPNAAGKSNLLEVVQFLGDTARLDLAGSIQAHGGFSDLRFRGDRGKGHSISLKVEAEVTKYSSPGALDVYSLSFHKSGDVLTREEEFMFKRTRGRGRRITVSGRKIQFTDEGAKDKKRQMSSESAALSTLPRLSPEEGADQVRAIAELFTTFRIFDVNTDAARLPSPSSWSSILAANAGNLAPFLHWLAMEEPEVFDVLEDDLGYILPGYRGIEFHIIGGAEEAVELRLLEAGLAGSTRLADASFGTVRALALLAMLHDPNPPKLTCVEEIDHGLHPYALDRIVERLRTAASRTQILVATHSPAFVNRLKPGELIICERHPETGASLIPARDASLVAKMASEAELGLGELWFSGSLGGVPQ